MFNSWKKRFAFGSKVFATNIGLILVGLLIIEAIFGSWFRAPNLWSLSIYRNKDWTYTADDKYPSDNVVNYKRDYYGLRGNYGEITDVDILTLGGSTTDERFVTEGETWTDTLDTCLEKRVGTKIGTANAGVTGQTTRGHAKNFDIWLNQIPGLAPKYILAYFGVNERGIHALADKDDVRDFNESDRPISRLKILRKWIYMNSAIYAAWAIVRGNLAAYRLGFAPYRRRDFDRRVFKPGEFKGQTGVERINIQFSEDSKYMIAMETPDFQQRVDVERERNYEKLSALSNRLKALTDKISDFGSIPVFITQSWGHYRIQNRVVRGDLDLYFSVRAENETIMDFCAGNNIFCINLAEKLEFHDNDFWDSVHTSPQGSRRVGEFICEHLFSWNGFSLSR